MTNALFQLIRRSRPGTRVSEGVKIAFREDAASERVAKLNRAFEYFEFSNRGHSHLFKKDLLSTPSEDIKKIESGIARMIEILYTERHILSEECLNFLKEFPAPEARFIRSGFNNLMKTRINALASKHPNCTLSWDSYSFKAKIILRTERFTKEYFSTFDIDEVFRNSYDNLSSMYAAFTQMYRKIEKDIETIIKDPKAWPSTEAEMLAERDRAKRAFRRILNSLSQEEQTLLRNHPDSLGPVLRDFLRGK